MGDGTRAFLKMFCMIPVLVALAGCGKTKSKETNFVSSNCRKSEFVIRVIGVENFSCCVDSAPPDLRPNVDQEQVFSECVNSDQA